MQFNVMILYEVQWPRMKYRSFVPRKGQRKLCILQNVIVFMDKETFVYKAISD